MKVLLLHKLVSYLAQFEVKTSQNIHSSDLLLVTHINSSYKGLDKEGYLALPRNKISVLLSNQTLCCGYSKHRLIETIIFSTQNKGLHGQIRILEHAKRPLSRAYK